MSKNYFQEIHYKKRKVNLVLFGLLFLAECFYKTIIKTKNAFYKIGFLKEKKVNAQVICIGNLTTGGVGKTPIVIELSNQISKTKKTAIISRGYGAKLSNKMPNIIKDSKGIKFKDGTLCGDEPFQTAKKVCDNVVVITCKDRYKAAKFAIEEYGIETIILDDGFSNRKLKKDKTIVAIDSKMRFGSGHLLPLGPLREPVSELNRADEVILVNKGDKDFCDCVTWIRNVVNYKKELKTCKMTPCRVYNLQTKAIVKNSNKQKAIAFCAIGQPSQFFEFAREYYELIDTVAFDDHHKYDKKDIKKLLKMAKEKKVNAFITTQKDETKLKELLKTDENATFYSFNVLELKNTIEEIKD